MQKRLLSLLLLSAIALAGCTGASSAVTEVVKAQPQVEQFLEEHPNAEIDVVLWRPSRIEDEQEAISEECLPAINTEQTHYRVEVTENGENIVAWAQLNPQQIVCVKRKGHTTDQPTETSHCTTSTPMFSGQEVGLDSWSFTDTNSISFVVEAINNDVEQVGVVVDTDDDGTYDYGNYTTHDISSGQTQEIHLNTGTEFSSGDCATARLRINYTMSGISGDIKATGEGNLRALVPNKSPDRDIQFVALACDAGSDQVVATIKNTGSKHLDLIPVDMNIYGPDNNDLNIALSQLGISLATAGGDPVVSTRNDPDISDPGDTTEYTINTGDTIEPNRNYRIEFVFTDENEFTIAKECVGEQAEESQDRGIDFVDLQCSNNGGNARVTAFLKNTGQKELDLTPVDLLVRDTVTGDVNFRLMRTGLSLASGSLSTGVSTQSDSDISSPGSSEQYHIDNQNSNTFTSGNSYVIEFQFTDEEDLTVSDICRAD